MKNKKYKFTENWFNDSELNQFLPINTKEELHVLEIGSFIEIFSGYCNVVFDGFLKAIKKK